MFRRIAIIGGGAAATALLSELLEQRLPQPLHVDWYTGGRSPARGVAFATRSPHHLLNVRAASMGLFSRQPLGFLDFVQQQDPDIGGTDFLPRSRYGDYLEAEMQRALERGNAHGHDLNIIPFEVDALVPEKDGVTVIRGEESQRVDAVVLALGALPPAPHPGVETSLLASGQYVTDPWQLLNSLDQREAPRKVAVIGMGLTAVDILAELSWQWPETEFVAFSRRGQLPEAHMKSVAVPSSDGLDLVESMREAPEIRQWLRRLRETLAHEKDWRGLIDSLRPYTPELWCQLPMVERARFLRHAASIWERARHRMAPQVSIRMAELEQQGRLQRRRGRLQSVTPSGTRIDLTTIHAGQAETCKVDLVIQATGLGIDVRQTEHRLIKQLRTNAHIQPDPLGLGLSAMVNGRLQYGNDYWPHLFAMGSLMRGTRWESAAMPEIRQQARSIARQLLKSPVPAVAKVNAR